MRQSREAPRQLTLEFDSIFGEIESEIQTFLRSNVVAVDFVQHREGKIQAVDREETRTSLQHVLSAARKLSW